jgi:hypothetical protein
MRVAVGTRAAFRGDRVPSEVVFPAASGEAAEPPPTAEPLAAKPPMAAAEPLSLFLRVRFDGLLTVADSDMIVDGGTIDL